MKVQTTLGLLALLALLTPPVSSCDDDPRREPGSITGTAGGRKVLLIGIDGLATYTLRQGSSPNIDALADAGAYSYEGTAGDITISGPGWSSMLTGTWRDRHGVNGNDFVANTLGATPDLFTLLRDAEPGAFSASLVMWPPINELIVRGADTRLDYDPCPASSERFVSHEGATSPPCRFLFHAEQLLANSSPDVLFLAWNDVDAAGHAYGWASERYYAALSKVDREVGLVLDALRARPTYASEEWLVVLSSDHGGSGRGHGQNSVPHRLIPIFISGPGVRSGPIVPAPEQVDLVPTILYWLLGDLDPDWNLDGKVIALDTEELSSDAARYRRPELPRPRLGANLVFNGDAEVDRGAHGAFDLSPRGWGEIGAMTSVPISLLPTDDPTVSATPPASSPPFDNAFVFGATGVSTMYQQVDLPTSTSPTSYRLSARATAGHSPSCHGPRLTVRFSDAFGRALAEDEARPTEPVTCDSYSFVPMATEGPLPAGARTATLTLNPDRDPAARGFIDDISLVLQMDRAP